MKKSKVLLVSLLAGAVMLPGCDAISNLFNKNSETNTSQNSTNNGQNTQLSVMDTLKGYAKSIAADIFEVSESSITFGEYEDEDAEADVYYYDSSNLKFAYTGFYMDGFGDEAVEYAVSLLPEGATLESNYDDDSYESEGVLLFDRYYILGDYCFDVYAESYDEMEFEGETYEAETDVSIYIFPKNQMTAFNNYFSEE